MAKSIEMITTIILLDPVKAAAKAIEVLTDLLLMRDPTKNPEKPTIMQVPECTMPIVQATIQVIIICYTHVLIQTFLVQRSFSVPDNWSLAGEQTK